MIKASDLTLKHKDSIILNNVSFSVPQQRVTVFVGPSGAGKTSILRCVANLIKHYTGTIEINGIPLTNLNNTTQAQYIGMVFQSFNLFPHMTALENCTHPLTTVNKAAAKSAAIIAHEKLSLVGMAQHHHKYPAQLSGGQQQRVAIARALCLGPKLLLLDEPSSALDPYNTALLIQTLKLLQSNGITIALSSHDMSLVKELLDHVYLIKNGSIVESYDSVVDVLKQKEEICGFIDHKSFPQDFNKS